MSAGTNANIALLSCVMCCAGVTISSFVGVPLLGLSVAAGPGLCRGDTDRGDQLYALAVGLGTLWIAMPAVFVFLGVVPALLWLRHGSVALSYMFSVLAVMEAGLLAFCIWGCVRVFQYTTPGGSLLTAKCSDPVKSFTEVVVWTSLVWSLVVLCLAVASAVFAARLTAALKRSMNIMSSSGRS